MNLKTWICISCFLSFCFSINAEALFRFGYQPGDKYKIREVSDLRRRVNNKYQGLTYREVRGILDVVSAKGGSQSMSGNFYVFSETKHNTSLISNQVDKVVPASFSISPGGAYTVPGEYYYPTSRNFPLFPEKTLETGDKWQVHGIRYVEPFNDGVFTRVEFYCDYKYEGINKCNGIPSHLITARYAIRYKAGDDPNGDPRIREIKYGGHEVTICVGIDTGRPFFMRDQIIENLGGEMYILSDNSTITLRGSTLTWFDDITKMQKDDLIAEIKEQIDDDKDDITVEESDDGVMLSLSNIRFYPDSEKILPGEQARLNRIFEILSGVAGRTFLITGHTADVGNPEGQYNLSVRRAKAIADYLVAKGLHPNRFLYEGKGATVPVAPNDIEENMAKNRRVEITILED